MGTLNGDECCYCHCFLFFSLWFSTPNIGEPSRKYMSMPSIFLYSWPCDVFRKHMFCMLFFLVLVSFSFLFMHGVAWRMLTWCEVTCWWVTWMRRRTWEAWVTCSWFFIYSCCYNLVSFLFLFSITLWSCIMSFGFILVVQ